VRPRQLRHLDDLGHGSPRHVNRYVVANGAVEEKVLLQYDPDLAPQPHGISLLQVNAIDKNPDGLRHIQPLQEFGERALARTAAPHHSNRGSGRNDAREVAQYLGAIEVIAKPHTFYADRSLNGRQTHLAG